MSLKSGVGYGRFACTINPFVLPCNTAGLSTINHLMRLSSVSVPICLNPPSLVIKGGLVYDNLLGYIALSHSVAMMVSRHFMQSLQILCCALSWEGYDVG